MTLAHPKPVRVQRLPRPLRRVRIARVSKERGQSGKVDKPRKRLPKVKKTSRGKMGRTADKLFSLIVRHGGECLYHVMYGGECKGGLQCAHVVSRRYRSTRWSEDNARPLCAGAHRFFTGRQIEWDDFVECNIMTPDEYAALKRRALQRWDGDIEGVLVRLAARAVALGLEAK